MNTLSADIKRAFDSLETWSQAMSWRALGMPEDIIQIMTNADTEGETEVIIGQGRTTTTEAGNEGRFRSGRGVRQGSIGGPIKWVVFMNFWLEYIHVKMRGKGYKMSEDTTTEILGRMFVDDSTWVTGNVTTMTEMINNCETFVNFHALEFNKKKSEYAVINQRADEDDSTYERPEWENGDMLHEIMRKHQDTLKWKKRMEEAAEVEQIRKWRALEMNGEYSGERNNPTQETHEGINRILDEWKQKKKLRWQNQEQDHPKQLEKDREQIIMEINKAKRRIYVEATDEEIDQATNTWWSKWDQCTSYIVQNTYDPDKSMRYLGVFYTLDLENAKGRNTGWKAQRKVLQNKFVDLNSRINRSNPTRHQTIYCINAVINAALKFPMQVANVPESTLNRWDTANRKLVCKAGKLPPMSPEMIHLPKEQGGLGLQNLSEATKVKIISDQMRYLNQSHTIAGRVVRAAHKRHNTKGDRMNTLQKRISEATQQLALKITGSATTRDYIVMEKITQNYTFATSYHSIQD